MHILETAEVLKCVELVLLPINPGSQGVASQQNCFLRATSTNSTNSKRSVL
jgi:hypothetical protein